MHRSVSLIYKITALLLFIIGIIVVIRFNFIGVSWWTEPYQILNSIDYQNTPAAPLFTYISHKWGNIFGFTISSMKLFSSIVVLLTLFISTYFYYLYRHNIWNSIFLFGTLSLLTITVPHILAFGWDIISNLFVVSSLILLLLFIDRPTIKRLFVLSIVSVAAVLSRCPNIILVLVCCLYLVLTRQWKFLFQYILIIGISFAISILLIYGSFNHYITTWESVGLVNGHSIRTLIGCYIMGFINFSPVLFITILAFIGCRLPKWGKWILTFTTIIVTILFLYYKAIPGFQLSFTQLYAGIVISSLLFIGYDIYCISNNYARFEIISLVIILFFMFIPCIGSDTGLIKMMSLPIIPIIFAKYNVRNYRCCFIAILIGITFFMPIYLSRNYSYPKKTIELPNIGIVTTGQHDAYFLSSIYDDIKLYDNILITGNAERYQVELLLNYRPTYAIHDYNVSPNTPEYVDKTEKYIEIHNPKTVFIVCSTENTSETLMDNMLLRHGYIQTKYDDRYRIYIK